ncbi:YhdP family protein [Thiomicrorhabdus sp. Milos-T2]|uniref:YhdP family phospholipid transporter n=1 Tax=Thiomicrorhabdus sp. Milos-T2 TaxID=90814 RepID=UPI0004943990|nr:AsmA-like C-terminal region-containing protein [Thiomicrorhabdus sp. Milos-T2]
MLIKRTHHFLQWAFWLFVAYLLITRLFISWVQFFPEQFIGAVQSATEAKVTLKKVEIDQGWLGFSANFDHLSVDAKDFQFQADKFHFDINLLALFIPKLSYGDALEISQGSFQNKVKPKASEANIQLNPDELVKVNLNIGKLWKRVSLKNLVLSEVGKPGLSIQFHDFQSLNASRLTIVSEFSLSYKDALNYERFHLKSSFTPDVWGRLGSGQFSLSSFKPLQIQRLSQLLSKNWQAVLPQGELILDLKGKITHSEIADLEVNLHSQALHWTQKQAGLPTSLGMQLVWNAEQQNIQKHFKDWRFTLAKIEIDNKFINTVSPIELYFEKGQYLNFNAEYFDIEPFKVLVKSLIATPHVASLFDRTAFLSISKLNGKLDWQSLDVPELAINFDKLDVPVTDYPGLSLQGLQVVKTPKSLVISTKKPIWIMEATIHSKPMKLVIPKLLEFKRNESNQAWQLAKTNLKLDDLSLKVALKALTASSINSQFELKVNSIQDLKTYLPYKLMTEELKSWLANSLKGGENIVLNGVLKGAFTDFPFDKGNGEFKVNGRVENAQLKFNPKWPMLKEFNADLEFEPYKLNILVDKINLGTDINATDVHVNIPDLDKFDIGLSVKGQVKTTLNKSVNYLSLSPIASRLGVEEFFKDNSKFSGLSKVVVNKIWVPISGFKDREPEVDGRVIFDNANLKLHEKLNFKHINGELKFTESGVTSKKLQFEILEGKGNAQIVTDSKNKQVKIKANGKALDNGHEWFKKAIPWNSTVTIPFKSAKAKELKVDVLANLSKAESLLPLPLNTKALSGKKLEVKTQISKGNIHSSIKLPGLVASKLHWKEVGNQYQLESNQIALGRAAPLFKSYLKESSFIRGNFENLDVDSWIPVLKNLKFFNSKKESQQKLHLENVYFNIGNTHFLSHPYKGVVIKLNASGENPVSLDIKSKDVDGQIVFVKDDLINVNLKHFHFYNEEIKAKEKSSKEESRKQNKSKLSECKLNSEDSVQFPKVVLKGKNIIIENRKVDSISLTLEDSPESLNINDVKGSFGSGAGTLAANYQYEKQSQQSQFNAKLNSNDVSAVTKFLDLNEGFSGKSAEVNLKLNWKGSLNCFSTTTVDGGIVFNIKDGSVEDIEPGFARLIGLLSVDSLVRRLKLDLKDVTNKGMIYDQIKGNAKLKSGMLDLNKLTIKAPSANGQIKGNVNIENQTFDLNANITPKVGATIPTIAALAGAANPLTALAVYTLMKVIPGVNENLITYKYKITGPWSKPLIDGEDNVKNKKTETKVGSDSVLDIN